jgi:hypothetical protein
MKRPQAKFEIGQSVYIAKACKAIEGKNGVIVSISEWLSTNKIIYDVRVEGKEDLMSFFESGLLAVDENGNPIRPTEKPKKKLKAKQPKAYSPLETDIQQAAIKEFNMTYPKYRGILFAVPNAGKRSTIVVRDKSGGYKTVCSGGNKLKAEGMVAGVADTILLVAHQGYGSLCLELKTDTGTQSENQKEWQKVCEAHGNKYVVVRSVNEFMKEIRDYLND